MRVQALGGWGSIWALASSLSSAGYTPEESTSFWSRTSTRSHRRPNHSGRKARLSKCRCLLREAESDFWLSPEIAAKAPKDAQPFFQSGKPSQRRTSRPVSGTRLAAPRQFVDGMQLVPLPGHTPGHTGYEFSSKGQKILFWGDIVHALRVQLQHPEVTAIFDIDQTALRRHGIIAA